MSINVLVCGAGSIGSRHIKNLKTLGASVTVWRARTELIESICDEYGVEGCASLDAALSNTDAVVIATATDTHIDIAKKAAKLGKSIYLEKPVSHTLAGVAEFKNIAYSKKLVIEVGCQLRAHPNLKRMHQEISNNSYGPLYSFRAMVGQRLDEWRPGTDYRNCYSCDASRGGGALLDLIHEIDLVNWFAGPISKVYADLSHVSNMEMRGEDLVNAVLVTESGAVGQIQMDMLSPVYRRGLELVFRDAIYTWDYVRGVLTRETKFDREIISLVEDGFERNTLFLEHMNHFLDRIIGKKAVPMCSLDDGITALKIAHASRLSSNSNSGISIEGLGI